MKRRRQKPIDYVAPTGKSANDQLGGLPYEEAINYVVAVGFVLTELLEEGDPEGVVERVAASCRLNGSEHAHKLILALYRKHRSGGR